MPVPARMNDCTLRHTRLRCACPKRFITSSAADQYDFCCRFSSRPADLAMNGTEASRCVCHLAQQCYPTAGWNGGTWYTDKWHDYACGAGQSPRGESHVACVLLAGGQYSRGTSRNKYPPPTPAGLGPSYSDSSYTTGCGRDLLLLRLAVAPTGVS